jgi:hypothetical protein
MKRWTAISASTNADKRWPLLSEALRTSGAANEFVSWTGAVEGWHDRSGLDGFDHIRLDPDLNSDVPRGLKIHSSWITLLGVIDGMIKREGMWWPLCALYESFSQILIGLGHDMDMRGNVLVAGRGGTAKVAIASFFKLGFTRFLLADASEQGAEKIRREVQKSFLGSHVDWVPRDGIVLLPAETSVLVNCAGPEQSDLLTELSYLNFLRRSGFLFDIGLSSKPGLLAQEAHDAGVRVVSGVEFAVRADAFWAQWAFNVQIDVEQYREQLLSVLRA